MSLNSGLREFVALLNSRIREVGDETELIPPISKADATSASLPEDW